LKLRKWNRVAIVALLSSFSFVYVAHAGPGGFIYTGKLNTARALHTQTLLNNGMVLIAGGQTAGAYLSSAELYSPSIGTFTFTGSLNFGRVGHTATLLSNGMVLIVGGGAFRPSAGSARAELYNPSTGTFTYTGTLNTTRASHTATLLNNGMVLIAGGYGPAGILSSAELYNPSTGTFSVTGSMNAARENHTATLLNNGMVLMTGGDGPVVGILSSAELYNPSTGTFSVTGSMNAAREYDTATRLNNGMVLITGGKGASGYLSSAELYNPSTGTFSVTGSLSFARTGHSTTLLNDGMALIIGGTGPGGCGRCSPSYLSSAELYNPSTGTFGVTGSLNAARTGHTATLLNNGFPLIAGGAPGVLNWLSSAELYLPNTNLLVGSTSGDSSSSTFESYDDAGVRLRTGNLSVSRSSHTATLLLNGTLFVAGGVQAPGSWQILDINGNILGSGSLLNGFYGHFAVLLGNGNVFLGGGVTAPGTWEIRGPTGAFVSSGSFLGSRSSGAGAVLLQNGNVWIFGDAAGLPGGSDNCSWEIRTSSGNLVTNGTFQTCFSSRQVFTLSNGDIIFLGGVQTAGQYDIYTQAGALVRSSTLTDGFDGNAGGALVGNNVLLFEHGYWEYLGFDANANTAFDTVGSLFDQRQSSGVAVTSTGQIFITGGDASPATWEMYTPNGTTVTLSGHGNLFNTRAGGHSLTHF